MISNVEMLIRLLLGAALGGIIGFERHTHGRPAGIRTHLLVSVASVLVMIVSEYYHFITSIDPAFVHVDPGRIAAGAITGIGFLGAGVIIKSGVNVHGLTTAACIWMVSAIGLAIGGGFYIAGIASFVITYLSLWTLRKIEGGISKLTFKFITVVKKGRGEEEILAGILEKYGLTVSNMDYERDEEKDETTYYITGTYKGDAAVGNILEEMTSLPSIKRVLIRG